MKMRRSILSRAERVEESLAFLSPILAAFVLAIRIAASRHVQIPSQSLSAQMEAAPRHHLRDFASLAVTLVILSLGMAMIAWEWRKAHTAPPPQTSQALHQHRARGNSPEPGSADHQ